MKVRLLSVVALLVCTLLPTPSVLASSPPTRPFRGSVQWSVLLCTFSDSATPPRTPAFYRDMFVNHNTGGLDDYWRQISYGGLNLDGSVVKGWYTEPRTVAQGQARNRNEKFQDCVDAARTAPIDSYTAPAGQLVAVVTYPDMDLFGMPGRGAFLPASVDLGAMAHEVGHGLGLEHSFSDDPNYRNADWAQIGEYDDQWDLMSYANVFGVATSQFGNAAPGLNVYHLDRMGWLQRDRILTLGADGIASRTVTLAALNHPSASGYLEVRVPFDVGDPFHYYTVELRRNDGWDGGFPTSIVLVHEIKLNPIDGQYHSYLLREHTGARAPLQAVNANGVSIHVDGLSPATNQATVSIRTQIVQRCLNGYVWREAGAGDLVCVTPAVRSQTRDENAQAAARRSPTGGPYGPDTCLVGYVWREAFPGDHVCVPPDRRTQARADNAEAGNRLLKP